MPRSWPTTMPGVTTVTVAAAVGQQLGDGGGLVEAELVDHDDPAARVGPALEHVDARRPPLAASAGAQ